MTTETSKQDTQVQPVALPPELASKMGVASIEAAVRAWADLNTKVSELELKLDKATKDATAAEERAVKAEANLNERVEKDTTKEVEALIAGGRISEDKREAALSLARSNIDSFRALYPAEESKPQAILREIVKPDAKEDNPAPAASESGENPIVKRANELQAQGKPFMAAWNQATAEHRAAS